MSKKWDDSDPCVYRGGKRDPPNDDAEGSVVDTREEDEEAAEKEEYREVEKGGQCFNNQGGEQFIEAASEECTNPRSIAWTVSAMGDRGISTCRLLQQRRQHGTCNTDGQAQEPE